jgi:hypothetical protein
MIDDTESDSCHHMGNNRDLTSHRHMIENILQDCQSRCSLKSIPHLLRWPSRNSTSSSVIHATMFHSNAVRRVSTYSNVKMTSVFMNSSLRSCLFAVNGSIMILQSPQSVERYSMTYQMISQQHSRLVRRFSLHRFLFR